MDNCTHDEFMSNDRCWCKKCLQSPDKLVTALQEKLETAELVSEAHRFRADIAGNRILELETLLEKTEAELDSLTTFTRTEIGKLPPEYVKGKTTPPTGRV